MNQICSMQAEWTQLVQTRPGGTVLHFSNPSRRDGSYRTRRSKGPVLAALTNLPVNCRVPHCSKLGRYYNFGGAQIRQGSRRPSDVQHLLCEEHKRSKPGERLTKPPPYICYQHGNSECLTAECVATANLDACVEQREHKLAADFQTALAEVRRETQQSLDAQREEFQTKLQDQEDRHRAAATAGDAEPLSELSLAALDARMRRIVADTIAVRAELEARLRVAADGTNDPINPAAGIDETNPTTERT